MMQCSGDGKRNQMISKLAGAQNRGHCITFSSALLAKTVLACLYKHITGRIPKLFTVCELQSDCKG